MSKEIITFGDNEIRKHKFHRYKSPILLENVNIDNTLVCNKISSGEENYKYFISYLYGDYKVKPLHIMRPKTGAYVKSYDGQSKGSVRNRF